MLGIHTTGEPLALESALQDAVLYDGVEDDIEEKSLFFGSTFLILSFFLSSFHSCAPLSAASSGYCRPSNLPDACVRMCVFSTSTYTATGSASCVRASRKLDSVVR